MKNKFLESEKWSHKAYTVYYKFSTPTTSTMHMDLI